MAKTVKIYQKKLQKVYVPEYFHNYTNYQPKLTFLGSN